MYNCELIKQILAGDQLSYFRLYQRVTRFNVQTKFRISLERTGYQNQESNYQWTSPFQLLNHKNWYFRKQAKSKSFKNKFGAIINRPIL